MASGYSVPQRNAIREDMAQRLCGLVSDDEVIRVVMGSPINRAKK